MERTDDAKTEVTEDSESKVKRRVLAVKNRFTGKTRLTAVGWLLAEWVQLKQHGLISNFQARAGPDGLLLSNK